MKAKLLKLLNYVYSLCVSKGDMLVLNGWINIKFGRVQKRNFGDELNFYILKELTDKEIVGYYDIPHFVRYDDLMFIGSLVEDFTTPNSIIWGSGAISGDKPIRNKPARIHAVRGKLTRKYLLDQGIECPEVYGDPAMLLPLIYPSKSQKKFKIGLIPHIHDLDDPNVDRLKVNPIVHLIKFNDYNNWHSLIDEINECEIIVSSSLHGLIIADAYKIPNVWVRFSDKIEGSNFKYLDFFSAVGRQDKAPFCLTENTLVEDIIRKASEYEYIEYDSSALINSCPFKLKIL